MMPALQPAAPRLAGVFSAYHAPCRASISQHFMFRCLHARRAAGGERRRERYACAAAAAPKARSSRATIRRTDGRACSNGEARASRNFMFCQNERSRRARSFEAPAHLHGAAVQAPPALKYKRRYASPRFRATRDYAAASAPGDAMPPMLPYAAASTFVLR